MSSIFMWVINILILILLIKTITLYLANEKALKIIYSSEKMLYLLAKYNLVGNYNKNLFNPFKWTFKQYFPGLED